MYRHTPGSRARLLAACMVLGAGGCASIDQATTDLVSSRTSASAVFAGHVLRGEAHFTHAHQATVQLDSDDPQGLSCFGELRFTASTGGIVRFDCNDGASLQVPFQSLSALRGSGRTQADGVFYALTYGLAPAMAAAYLGIAPERLARPAPPAAGAAPAPG